MGMTGADHPVVVTKRL